MHAQLVIPQPGKGNRKTGDIPTAYVARESCPLGCPLLGKGCYAETGNIGLHWRRMRGVPWATFCRTVAEKLGPRQLWRYAVAGDLPGFSGLIDRAALELLTAANGHRPVIAYTHKPVLDGEHPAAPANRHFIAEAIGGGFLVNLSANDPSHADALADLGLAPVVTILPHAYARRRRSLGRGRQEWSETIGQFRDRLAALPTHTPAGRRIAVCPATYTEATCDACRACARPREAVIGFPAHGGWRVVEQAMAARDVPPGERWTFADHRTMAEIIADEAAA
ncbi:MAG TPA: hypothetical protein VNF04_16370 [Stellaceae bacterium]|nr:hypothetical protein [Stellaceae bacterium]